MSELWRLSGVAGLAAKPDGKDVNLVFSIRACNLSCRIKESCLPSGRLQCLQTRPHHELTSIQKATPAAPNGPRSLPYGFVRTPVHLVSDGGRRIPSDIRYTEVFSLGKRLVAESALHIALHQADGLS